MALGLTAKNQARLSHLRFDPYSAYAPQSSSIYFALPAICYRQRLSWGDGCSRPYTAALPKLYQQRLSFRAIAAPALSNIASHVVH